MTPEATTREAWSSPTGFLLASIGSAVGIGNLWRFPYVVGTSGGGAFLLPYLIAVALCGLPLMILEFSLGRRFRSSVVPAFTAMHPGLRWLGFGHFAFGTVGMTLGALVLSLAAGWFVREKLLPGALMVIVKVVVPLALVASLIARLLDRG